MKLEVDDLVQITGLLSRYGLLLDQRRIDEWCEIFVEEAVIEIPGRPVMQTDGDRRSLAENSPRGVHLTAAPAIHVDAAGEMATAEQTYVFHNFSSGAIKAGWYEDTLVASDRQWRIARRVINFFA